MRRNPLPGTPTPKSLHSKRKIVLFLKPSETRELPRQWIWLPTLHQPAHHRQTFTSVGKSPSVALNIWYRLRYQSALFVGDGRLSKGYSKRSGSTLQLWHKYQRLTRDFQRSGATEWLASNKVTDIMGSPMIKPAAKIKANPLLLSIWQVIKARIGKWWWMNCSAVGKVADLPEVYLVEIGM